MKDQYELGADKIRVRLFTFHFLETLAPFYIVKQELFGIEHLLRKILTVMGQLMCFDHDQTETIRNNTKISH